MVSLHAISPRPAFKYSPWRESMLLLPLFQQFRRNRSLNSWEALLPNIKTRTESTCSAPRGKHSTSSIGWKKQPGCRSSTPGRRAAGRPNYASAWGIRYRVMDGCWRTCLYSQLIVQLSRPRRRILSPMAERKSGQKLFASGRETVCESKDQIIESPRLINKERMPSGLKNFDLSSRTIFLQILRLLCKLRRHDVEQRPLKAVHDAPPVCPLEGI